MYDMLKWAGLDAHLYQRHFALSKENGHWKQNSKCWSLYSLLINGHWWGSIFYWFEWRWTYFIFILEIEASHVFEILPKLITDNLLVDSMSAVSQSRREIFQHVPYYFCYWWVDIWPNAFSLPFEKWASFFFAMNQWNENNIILCFFFIILEKHVIYLIYYCLQE